MKLEVCRNLQRRGCPKTGECITADEYAGNCVGDLLQVNRLHSVGLLMGCELSDHFIDSRGIDRDKGSGKLCRRVMRIHERQRLIDEQVLVRLQSEPQYLAGQGVSVVLANSRKIRSFAK